MAQRVRKTYRGQMPFVCHTTPHSDSTSRRLPTLFMGIVLQISIKVNIFFPNSVPF